jgi:hypothetical protein
MRGRGRSVNEAQYLPDSEILNVMTVPAHN